MPDTVDVGDPSAASWDPAGRRSPLHALRRRRDAADSGELEALCRRHGVGVHTVFGSAVGDPHAARDLDVAALPEPGRVLDLPALVACVPLYESRPGAYGAGQGAAVGERVDTDTNG